LSFLIKIVRGGHEALIILNVPMPYATGDNLHGIGFTITVDGKVITTGGFTYVQKKSESLARHPVTIVAI
jgi:hypothetical protein